MHLKDGEIVGQGMGITEVEINFNEPAGLRGLFAEADVVIRDMTITTVQDNSAPGNDWQSYALHIDTAGTFISRFQRVHFKSVLKFPNTVNPVPNPGITIGIGIWDKQRVSFEDCIIEGQNISYGNRSTANTHNQVSAFDEVVPGNVCFKNCTITGGFASILVADVNDGPGSDATRPKAVWEFLGCNIDSMKLKSFDPNNGNLSPNRKNGFKFNVAGSTCGLIHGAEAMIDSSLANYEATSLPLFDNVRFMKNTGTDTIVAGDAVCYVYGPRKAHWYLDQEYDTSIPVSIEKLTSTNEKNFAGFALVDSATGNFCHIVVSGLAHTNNTVGAVNDYLELDASGNFILSTSGNPVVKVWGKETSTGKTILKVL